MSNHPYEISALGIAKPAGRDSCGLNDWRLAENTVGKLLRPVLFIRRYQSDRQSITRPYLTPAITTGSSKEDYFVRPGPFGVCKAPCLTTTGTTNPAGGRLWPSPSVDRNRRRTRGAKGASPRASLRAEAAGRSRTPRVTPTGYYLWRGEAQRALPPGRWATLTCQQSRTTCHILQIDRRDTCSQMQYFDPVNDPRHGVRDD